MSFITGIIQSYVTIRKAVCYFLHVCAQNKYYAEGRTNTHTKMENAMLIYIYFNIMLLRICTMVVT